jgi:putative glutathione S-transferase
MCLLLAYDTAVTALYTALDRVEALLSSQDYLVGDSCTASDFRLFMTLIRFDEVYVVYFKCNVKRIADYPNIMRYMRRMWNIKGMIYILV